MAPVNTPLMKRSSSDSLLPSSDEPFAKHQKRSYHHHHRLQKPFEYDLREAAITDESTVAHFMNQAIGRVLSDAGFCFADPVALNSLQNATEECTRYISATGQTHPCFTLTARLSYAPSGVLCASVDDRIPEDSTDPTRLRIRAETELGQH